MSSLNLQYAGFSVQIHADDAASLEWLGRFFESGFESDSPGEQTFQVTMRVDAAGFDRYRSESGTLVDAFAGDKKNLQLEQLRSGSQRVFRDLRFPIVYEVDLHGRRIDVTAASATPKLKTAVMRVVRELAMESAVAEGATIVHGSAIANPWGIVGFSGPKRSGKTTLLMSLLKHTEARYVTNDRFALMAGEKVAEVRGLPTLVRIRRPALESFPDVYPKLEELRPDVARAWTRGRHESSQGESPAARTGFSLNSAEFLELMGARRKPEARGKLAALVYPVVTSTAQTMTLERIAPERAAERFAEGLFRAGFDSPLEDVFRRRSDLQFKDRKSDAETGTRVTGMVPCYECELVEGRAPTAAECEQLLQRIHRDHDAPLSRD